MHRFDRPHPPPFAGPANGKTPQQKVVDFWDGYIAKNPTRITSIFPQSLHGPLLQQQLQRQQSATGSSPPSRQSAATSYAEAVAECRREATRIRRDCLRSNIKYTDPDFDLMSNPGGCFLSLRLGFYGTPRVPTAGDVQFGLSALRASGLFPEREVNVNVAALHRLLRPRPEEPEDPVIPEAWSVHRINWIFDKPQFTLDGYSSSDIRQGAVGNCWWLSGVATICHRADLMARVCVVQEPECGIYGFVFCRDGEWIPVIVDDNLALAQPDYSEEKHDPSNDAKLKYKQQKQTGSDALLFAHCQDPNETWLPLLEKAYAKAHGDYESLVGGQVGEAVEDLTGGVTTRMATANILNKARLWKELQHGSQDFVFGLDLFGPGETKNGMATGHSYAILGAAEEVGEDGKTTFQLVKIRNPWGKRQGTIGEWAGPWSDGSKEWTPYWLNKLNYRFDDDGVFWMTYEDMLSTFPYIHRTRIFDNSWTVVQQWTNLTAAWMSSFANSKKFVVEVKEGGLYVFVLSQLDTRFFKGLEGQYDFNIRFLVVEEGDEVEDYLCRADPWSEKAKNRAVSCEVELEPGKYEIIPKVAAVRDYERRPVEAVLPTYARESPRKLRQIGLNFDKGNAKGIIPEPPLKEDPEPKDDKATRRMPIRQMPPEAPRMGVPGPSQNPIARTDTGFSRGSRRMRRRRTLPVPVAETTAPPESAGSGDDEPGSWEDEDDERALGSVGSDVDSIQSYEVDRRYQPPGLDLDRDRGGRDERRIDPFSPRVEDRRSRASQGWDAVCVVGFRVFSRDPGVTITIV